MTPFDRFAAEVMTMSRATSRLTTLERRHRVLEAGFARLEQEAAREHYLGRTATRLIARLARLDRWMVRSDTEALALIGTVLPLLAGDRAGG